MCMYIYIYIHMRNYIYIYIYSQGTSSTAMMSRASRSFLLASFIVYYWLLVV